ncbi:transcriptional regulator, TetR family [Lachnospiraceae bacterium KM106-2]|nr:transcriptional regulator, TetR family [Lachnospiraceae bacterium KM106-2]
MMERRKEMTKQILAESFQSLMEQHPFEKITIKMITDEAGVIRPTFYNYFQDKYEVLEWLISDSVSRSIYDLIDNDMENEAIKMVFMKVEKNKLFFRKGFEIQGQNSFKSILIEQLEKMVLYILKKHSRLDKVGLKVLNNENVALFYAIGLVTAIEIWVMKNDSVSASDIYEMYTYMVSHSIMDLIE